MLAALLPPARSAALRTLLSSAAQRALDARQPLRPLL